MRSGPPVDEELLPSLPAEERGRPFVDGVPGIEELRRALEALSDAVVGARALTRVRIEEFVVDDVPVIVVMPPHARSGRGALFSIHGGGLVAGGHRSGLEAQARVALELHAVIVIPDYRLAPEHPYPEPLDDVTTVWRWLAAGGLDGLVDLDRLVVTGGSSGGGLAAGLVLRLGRDGMRLPRALLLVQPQLDDRNELPSTHELENEHFWDRGSNITGWAAYLGDLDEVPPEAAPSRATDLRGFPPCFVEIAQVDLFRDEALEFVGRLSRAGVPVEAHLWAGAFHGFDGLADTPLARRAVTARLTWLRRMLAAEA